MKIKKLACVRSFKCFTALDMSAAYYSHCGRRPICCHQAFQYWYAKSLFLQKNEQEINTGMRTFDRFAVDKPGDVCAWNPVSLTIKLDVVLLDNQLVTWLLVLTPIRQRYTCIRNSDEQRQSAVFYSCGRWPGRPGGSGQ